MKKTLLLLAASLFVLNCLAQDKHIVDSLTNKLKNHTEDTTAANLLYELFKSYKDNNPEKAINYAKQTLALSEKIGYKKGIANAHRSIGAIFRNEGNSSKALNNFIAALKIFEQEKDQRGIASCYLSIGLIYNEQKDYSEAIINYNKSLKIFKEVGDKSSIAKCYINIGYLYDNQKKYPEALQNYLESLKIVDELGDTLGIAGAKLCLGSVYSKQGNYSLALVYEFAALKIFEKKGIKSDIASSFGNIAQTYMRQKKYNDAAQYLKKGLSIVKENGNLLNTVEFYRDFAALDSAMGDYKQALEHYKLFITTHEILINNENTKKITQQNMQYNFDKKELFTKLENEKELQKQKLVRNGLIGGFAIVLLFALVFFHQRNKISEAKKISEAEKERSEELLLNILPAEVADEIKLTGAAKAKAYTMVTVMFTDFKDFTKVSEKVSAELLVEEIHICFSAFDHILQKHKIEKIKTIGDAYLCASGLPLSNYTHAVDMLNAAFEIRSFIMNRKKEKEARGEIPFEIRIGIHTGPLVAGIVGVRKYAYDIWGDTVNLASRIEQNSEAGKINISESTYELVKNDFNCFYRGKIEAKNKGEIAMYFAEIKS